MYIEKQLKTVDSSSYLLTGMIMCYLVQYVKPAILNESSLKNLIISRSKGF